MQGSSKKHDLSPGDSPLPYKKLRIENTDFETKKSERFGPYSMRNSSRHSTPMIIRAKRLIPEDAEPHVTTTAQKIIETLARMSTPVANAQKVLLDPIKPLKPSFTNLRRNIDYGGPPILRSPLVASSSRIVSSPVVNNSITLRSLPKLVDSATNTEHLNPLEVVTYDDSDKHTGGGKIRRNLHRMHAAPLKKPSMANHSNNLGARNNVDEKCEFDFGTAWSAEEVIDAMAIRKEEKQKRLTEQKNTSKNVESDSEEESIEGSDSEPPKKAITFAASTTPTLTTKTPTNEPASNTGFAAVPAKKSADTHASQTSQTEDINNAMF